MSWVPGYSEIQGCLLRKKRIDKLIQSFLFFKRSGEWYIWGVKKEANETYFTVEYIDKFLKQIKDDVEDF